MEKISSRPVWNGSISFGLVNIPIKLYTAIREKRLHFRTLHDQDKVPLKQKMICPADGKEVHPEHAVKGFEVAKDHFVVVRQEELDAAAPKATRAIEIEDFVDLDEIDPVFFDQPYYVIPKTEGVKAYQLLLKAMEQSGKVGIANIVMHTKQYLAALRPIRGVLCLETMHFNDEVVSPEGAPELAIKSKVDDRELKVAQQLIDSLTTKFDPGKYHDHYREQVMELLAKKAKGAHIQIKHPDEAKPSRQGDLIAALEASVAKAKGGKPAPTPRRRKSA